MPQGSDLMMSLLLVVVVVDVALVLHSLKIVYKSIKKFENKWVGCRCVLDTNCIYVMIFIDDWEA